MIEMADDSKCIMFEHEVLRFIWMRLTESTIADLIPKFHYEVFLTHNARITQDKGFDLSHKKQSSTQKLIIT